MCRHHSIHLSVVYQAAYGYPRIARVYRIYGKMLCPALLHHIEKLPRHIRSRLASDGYGLIVLKDLYDLLSLSNLALNHILRLPPIILIMSRRRGNPLLPVNMSYALRNCPALRAEQL